MAPAPPSFSSFPDLPDRAAPDEGPRPSKRVRGAMFLDALKDELTASGRILASGSRSGEHDRPAKHRSKSSRSSRPSDSDSSTKPYKLLKALNSSHRSPPPTETAPAVPEPRLFYSDRRGDEFNVRYGSLHKGDVPRYRRLGAGRIVGLNAGLRITKESAYTNRGLEVGAHTTFRTPRYTDPRSAQHATSRHTKRLAILAPGPPSAAALGSTLNLSTPTDPFLATSSDPTRFVAFEPERSIPDVLATLEHQDGQDYRSISGLVKPSDLDPDSDAEDALYDGLGIDGGESYASALRRRTIELDRSLRDKPTDVDAWISFVEFQDEVAAGAERRATAEIKISILDRALAVPENAGDERLLLALLRQVGEVWDPKDVRAKWDETLRKWPGLTGLWIEYVGWRQTSWVTFSVRDVVEVFVECFQVLGSAAEKEQVGSVGRETLEGNEIYLFLRCCLMLRQAGFAERALAAFQAIVELNLFRPADLAFARPSEPEVRWLSRAFTSLESFWDSGAPRVGEPASLGWKDSLDADAPLAPAPPALAPLPSSTTNPFERWAATERLTSTCQPLPARPDDPGVDDDVDPFRVVLFDDLRDVLFVVHAPSSLEQLAYAFLSFLGLPFTPPDCSTNSRFSTDAFIHSQLAEREGPRGRFWPKRDEAPVFQVVGGEPMQPERTSAVEGPWDAPFGTTPACADMLFATRPRWFVALDKVALEGVDIEFARNVFASLRPFINDGLFTLNHFAFEAALSPKSAIKLAKTVLRTQRSNLALWDAYARIERARAKVAEARAVYVTALGMSPNEGDSPLLWRAWAEMEWEEGRPMLALKVLVASAGGESVDLGSLVQVEPDVRPSPPQVLRALKYYTTLLESSFQPSVTQSTLRNRTHAAYSSTLLSYISHGLPSAVSILEQHLFRLDVAGALGSAEHEEALMLYSKLLFRHAAAGGGFRPGQLRDVLERAIGHFPNNSLFLGVFFHNELRTKIQNRVRRTLDEKVLKDKTVTSEGWLFAIWAEAHLDSRSMNVWGVRNLFDRAVENPRTRPSPSVWTMFIDFELRNGELARAKSLLYRAIHSCPWVKELYLKPFSSTFRTAFRAKELRELHSLLLEKGLRVRVELDEFVEVGFRDEDEMQEDEAPVADVLRETEELYEERRRLMPY